MTQIRQVVFECLFRDSLQVQRHILSWTEMVNDHCHSTLDSPLILSVPSRLCQPSFLEPLKEVLCHSCRRDMWLEGSSMPPFQWEIVVLRPARLSNDEQACLFEPIVPAWKYRYRNDARDSKHRGNLLCSA